MDVIARNFKIDLALNPVKYNTVGSGAQMRGIDVEMDGEKLTGVNSLCIKSGANGYTNVVLEMEAETIINMVAGLVVGVEDETFDEKVTPLILKVMDDNGIVEGEYFDFEGMQLIIKTILKLLIENGKKEDSI